MSKPVGKLFRLRRSRLLTEGCILVCLPLGFRDALLDACERLEWAATWIEDNGDRAQLSDSEWAIIEEGIEALTMACEITVNVENNISGGGSGGACCNNVNTNNVQFVGPDGQPVNQTNVPIGPGPVTQPPVNGFNPGQQSPPAGFDDWQEWLDSRCLLANYAVDTLIKEIEALANSTSSVLSAGVWLAIIYAVFPPAAIATKGGSALFALVLDLLELLGLIEGSEEVLEEVAQVLRDNHDEAVCLIYGATNIVLAADTFYQWLWDKVQLLPSVVGLAPEQLEGLRRVIERLTDTGWMNIAFSVAAQALIPDDYAPSYNCAQCEDPGLLVAEWSLAGDLAEMTSQRIVAGCSQLGAVLSPGESSAARAYVRCTAPQFIAKAGGDWGTDTPYFVEFQVRARATSQAFFDLGSAVSLVLWFENLTSGGTAHDITNLITTDWQWFSYPLDGFLAEEANHPGEMAMVLCDFVPDDNPVCEAGLEVDAFRLVVRYE